MPCFFTATEIDIVVALVLLLGALQPSYSYRCCTSWGPPSVTVMGERSEGSSWADEIMSLTLNSLEKMLSRKVPTAQEGDNFSSSSMAMVWSLEERF